MRTAVLTLILGVAISFAAHSQRFSLVPQVGFETSKTSLSYNDGEFFAPQGVKFSPMASLRFNYASKKGHGFFAGASSSRSAVVFSFADPETGMLVNSTTPADMQIRFEGGYQFNGKKISLQKSGQQSPRNTSSESKATSSDSYSKSSCRPSTYTRSSCGNKSKQSQASSKKGTWMRIQPSIGMGYVAGGESDIVAKTQNGQLRYEYRAGNWKTALLAGTGFEFGRGNARLFTVSLGFVKGLDNMSEEKLVTTNSSKTIVTTLSSKSTSWNLRVGIPFTLGGGGQAARTKTEVKKKTSCQQTYRIQYKRCGN